MRARSRVIGTRCSVRAPACRRRPRCRNARRRSRCRHGGHRCGLLLHEPDHVGLRQPTVPTGSGDRRGVELILLDQPAHRGAELPRLARAVAITSGGRCASGRRRGSRCGRGRRRWRRGRDDRLRRRRHRALLDHGQHLAARHDGSALHPQLTHHAVGGRRHFQHHLVGLEVGEILVATRRPRRAACARPPVSRPPPIQAAAEPGFRSS